MLRLVVSTHRILDSVQDFTEDKPVDYVQENKGGWEDHSTHTVNTNGALAPLFHYLLGVVLFAPGSSGATSATGAISARGRWSHPGRAPRSSARAPGIIPGLYDSVHV